jgi:hypothetical protein
MVSYMSSDGCYLYRVTTVKQDTHKSVSVRLQRVHSGCGGIIQRGVSTVES